MTSGHRRREASRRAADSRGQGRDRVDNRDSRRDADLEVRDLIVLLPPSLARWMPITMGSLTRLKSPTPRPPCELSTEMATES